MDLSQDYMICRLMGFATLEWQGGGQFRAPSPLPPWWSLLDTASASGASPFEISDPFLTNFLVDARELWEGSIPERLSSGVWHFRSQNGTDLALEAFALHTGTRKLLLVQNTGQGDNAAKFLQQGRGSKLTLLRDIARRRQLELELRAGIEQARRLDRAKTEFVAHVSHEMRTPLTTILGMCEFMSDGSLSKAGREHLQTLELSARSLLVVVSDLLDVARVESGTISVHDEPFAPLALVRRLENDYRPAAVEREIDLHVDVADNIPETMTSDPNRLLQILNNLVDNAIKFTSLGEVRISVRHYHHGAHPILQFEVTDTGVGIHLPQSDVLIDSLVPSGLNAAENPQGMGIGLAIARRLADAIGGEISVESEPGKGSTFRLVMPVHREEPSDIDTRAAAMETKPLPLTTEVVSNAETCLPESLSILVAEDNPVNRKFMARTLIRAGHDVVAVANGQQVLDQASQRDFDVVLMDCQMPILNGYETTTELRAKEKVSGEYLPIIAVTAHAMEDNRKRCGRMGMDFFVTKPFTTSDLIAIVRQAAMHRKRQPA